MEGERARVLGTGVRQPVGSVGEAKGVAAGRQAGKQSDTASAPNRDTSKQQSAASARAAVPLAAMWQAAAAGRYHTAGAAVNGGGPVDGDAAETPQSTCSGTGSLGQQGPAAGAPSAAREPTATTSKTPAVVARTMFLPPSSSSHTPGMLPFEYRPSPLHAAVEAGDLGALQQLLESGAHDLEALNSSGETALVMAVNLGRLEAIEVLVEAGALRHYRIHWAAQNGHAKSVAELLAFGAPADLPDEYGVTPIAKAAMNGHTAVVNELLAKGAEVKRVVEGDLTTPLLLAAANGHVDAVLRLLAAGASVEDRDAEERSPLILAGLAGSAALIKALLAAGDELNEVDAAGNTALHMAAHAGHVAAVKELLGAGSMRDRRNATGETPLVGAILGRHAEVEAALGAAGANPHFRLHWAAQRGDTQVVKDLLLGQSPVNLQDDLGWTALNVASQHGQLEVASLLLDAHASVHLPASSGHTPLVSAAENGHAPIVKLLLGAGADLRAVTEQGQTALHLAAANSNEEAVFELLAACRRLPLHGPPAPTWMEQRRDAMQKRLGKDAGGQEGDGASGSTGTTLTCATMTATMTSASGAQLAAALEWKNEVEAEDNERLLPLSCPGIVDAQDVKGNTAVLLAAAAGQQAIVKMLLAAGATIDRFNTTHNTPLHAASIMGHTEVVHTLIAAGAPLELGSKDKDTALHCAALSGNLDIVRYLIAAEAVVDVANRNGETPLALAAILGHVEVMRFLISKNANVDARDSAGRTVLSMAAESNQRDSLHLLLEAGCTVNVQSHTGFTVLHAATGCMDTEDVDALLAAGVNPRLACINGSLPLHIAAERGHLGAAKSLLAAGVPVDSRDSNQSPALHIAIHSGNIDVARELLNHGADPNSSDWEGDTPLTIAGRSGAIDIVDDLLERGARLLDYTHEGMAAVHCAAMEGSLLTMKRLLDEMQDKLLPTSSGRTLVHLAAAFGKAKVVEHLLAEGGMDANQTCQQGQRRKQLSSTFKNYDHHSVLVEGNVVTVVDSHGIDSINTPLPDDRQLVYVEITITSCNSSHCDMVIGFGKDVGQYDVLPGLTKDTYGYEASSGARFTGSWASQELYGPKYGEGDTIGLIYNRAVRTVSYTRNGQHLGVACKGVPVKGQSLMVGFQGEGASIVVNFGDTPFKFNLDDLLVEEEGRHNPGSKEPWRFKEKTCPLHLAACRSGSLPVLELLLGAGAVVDQTDADQWTALHFAALHGWQEGIRVLLDKGANPNAVTAHGSTALQFAVKRSHTEASKVLLESGAQHKVVDKDRRTLLMCAASTGNSDIMQLLIDKGVGIKEKDALGRTAMQYACNEMVVNYLEKALNKILIYRDCFEINLQAETKRGAEGTVVLAKHVGSGNAVAIKFHKHREMRDYSASILRQLNPKFVAILARIKDETVFDDPSRHPDAPYAMVCEAGDKDLQEILDEQGSKPLPENQCRYIFECMVAAVRHLHSLDLVHHDLKAKNFVRFFDGRYCLVDFDNCRTVDKMDMGNTTIEICPPEVAASLLKGERLRSRTSMDVWSLGCCLYQMIMQEYLLADLRPEWKGDIFRRDSSEALMAWTGLQQEQVDRVLERITSSRKNVRLAQHAQSLLQHMLQVDPRKRFTIDDVVTHAFLKGGSTATMDEEVLSGIRTTLGSLSDKVDSVLHHVVRIDERTLQLADLPQQLQAGLSDICSRLSGLRAMVSSVAQATECPTLFIIAPELPPRQALQVVSGDASGRMVLTDWLDDLKQVFSGELTLSGVVRKLTNRRFRLRLVCEHCMRPCGEGYLIERPEAFTAKLLPALQVSFAMARLYNVAAGLGRFVFPMLPVVPPELMNHAAGVIASMRRVSTGSPDDFSCIQEEVSKAQSGSAKSTQPKSQVGASLRQLHAFLNEADPSHTWGGLAMVDMEDGEGAAATPGSGTTSSNRAPMWVCPECVATGGAHAASCRDSGARGAGGGLDRGSTGGDHGRPPAGPRGGQLRQAWSVKSAPGRGGRSGGSSSSSSDEDSSGDERVMGCLGRLSSGSSHKRSHQHGGHRRSHNSKGRAEEGKRGARRASFGSSGKVHPL